MPLTAGKNEKQQETETLCVLYSLKRTGNFLAALTLLGVAAMGAARADVVNFETDTTGGKPNGFMSVQSSLVSFSDSIGADLDVSNYGNQSIR